jgi:hypothetical protein
MIRRLTAELHCLNCARHLADLLHGSDDRAVLDHPAGQDTRPILVVSTEGGLRCARCGGRVLAEPPVDAHAIIRRDTRAA